MAQPGTVNVMAAGAGTITGSSYTIGVTSPSPAGASLVAVTQGSIVPTSTISDTQGNTWTRLINNIAGQNVQVFQAVSAAALNATDTLTVTKASGLTSVIEDYILVSVAQTQAADVTSAASGTSTAPAVAGTPSNGNGNELALVAIGDSAAGGTCSALSVNAGVTQFTQVTAVHSSGGPFTALYSGPVTQVAAFTATGTITSAPWAALLTTLPAAPVLQPAAPVVPYFIAGFGPQASDMGTLWYEPASFFQNGMVFRARQAAGSTTLPSSAAATTIAFDTIDEDPWSGWNASTHAWTPPAGYSGWYEATLTVWLQAPAAANVMLEPLIVSGPDTWSPLAQVPLPQNNPGAAECSWRVYLAGGQDSLKGQASLLNSSSNVPTNLTTGQQSSMEIVWRSS